MRPLVRFNTLIQDISSEEYHKMTGTFSSSQLKTMLEDPEVFYKKYITKEMAREESTAFDLGTYFHTALLEPHKLNEECVVYEGGIRSGKKWDEFKETHKGKAIITAKEKETAERMIKAVKNSPISMDYLNRSSVEVSAFIEIYVLGKEVFSFRGDVCYQLTVVGWVPSTGDYDEESIKEFGVRIVVKVRADAIAIGQGAISDLKSTTGNAVKKHDVMRSIGTYKYDLSAALYLDVFTQATGDVYDTFIWIFASKDEKFANARPWKASDKSIMVGRMKWKFAVVQLAKYLSNNWAFTEDLEDVGPATHDLEWLIEN